MGIPQDTSKALDLFKSLVFDNVVEAALVQYIGGVLAIPIIGPIINNIFMDFANLLYAKLQGVIVFSSIFFVDVAHRKAFEGAETGLKAIALDKGINSPEFISAHEKEKLALKAFGQFNIVQP